MGDVTDYRHNMTKSSQPVRVRQGPKGHQIETRYLINLWMHQRRWLFSDNNNTKVIITSRTGPPPNVGHQYTQGETPSKMLHPSTDLSVVNMVFAQQQPKPTPTILINYNNNNDVSNYHRNNSKTTFVGRVIIVVTKSYNSCNNTSNCGCSAIAAATDKLVTSFRIWAP